MGFNVLRSEVDDSDTTADGYAGSVVSALGDVSKAIAAVQGMDGLQGQAAENAKAYWGEAHAAVVDALNTAFNQLKMQFASYASGYRSIDGDADAKFNESTLDDADRWFSGRSDTVVDRNTAFVQTIQKVDDLVSISPSKHAGSAIEDLSECSSVPANLAVQVGQYEADQVQQAGQLDVLIGYAQQLVSALGSFAAGASYAPGRLAADPGFQQMQEVLGAYKTWQKDNAGQYKKEFKAVKRDQKVRRERAAAAKKREDDGKVEIFSSILAMVVAGFVIAGTGGAAAPVVLAIAGTDFVAHGLDIIEGAQDIYYGHEGKLGTSFNPLRDTVFGGNQRVYDAAETVLDLSAGGAAAGRGALANIAGGETDSIRNVVAAARATGKPVVLPTVAAVGGNLFMAGTATMEGHVAEDLIDHATGDSLPGRLVGATANAALSEGLGGERMGGKVEGRLSDRFGSNGRHSGANGDAKAKYKWDADGRHEAGHVRVQSPVRATTPVPAIPVPAQSVPQGGER